MFRKYLALLLLFALVIAQDDAGFDDEEDLAEDADEFADDAEDALVEGDEAEIEGDDEEAEVDAEADAEVAVEAEAEAPVAAAPVEKTLEELKEEEDLWILLIGIFSCVNVVWMIVWGMFVYIETSAADNTMCINSDCTVKRVPISWLWGGFTSTTMFMSAIGYFFGFIGYLLIALPEMIFWVMYVSGTQLENNLAEWLFNMWVSYPGLYGGWILFLMPWVGFLVQLTQTTLTQPGWVNAAVHMTMWLLSWLWTGILHTLGFPYVNRKFARELGHDPSVIPSTPVAEEAPAEEAPAEEPEEEVEVEVEVEEEPLDEEPEEDFEEEEEDADTAFNSTW